MEWGIRGFIELVWVVSTYISNQISFLVYEALRATINDQVEWWGYTESGIWVCFLRGSMCAEGMGCERRWVRWVLRGTGTASGHPGVS